jgi:hypothetical protein
MAATDKTHQDPANHHPPTGVQPLESEDPKAPGKSQHAQHHALKENTEGHAAERHPETPPGQHATGSFTEPAPALPKAPHKKSGQH